MVLYVFECYSFLFEQAAYISCLIMKFFITLKIQYSNIKKRNEYIFGDILLNSLQIDSCHMCISLNEKLQYQLSIYQNCLLYHSNILTQMIIYIYRSREINSIRKRRNSFKSFIHFQFFVFTIVVYTMYSWKFLWLIFRISCWNKEENAKL